MDRARKSVLIIGGGVAGATAADRLSREGIEAHVIEKSDDIGGRVASMGCKAADVCSRCNVCVADEIFRAVRAAAKLGARRGNGAAPIRLHLSSELLELKPGSGGSRFSAIVRNGASKKNIQADSVVIAIGYEPFNPAENSSFNYGKIANLITGAEAELRLARGWLRRPSDHEAPRRIAFIQCVGSRSEEIQRRPEDTNYCSTVCCSYAMRIAKQLKYRAPDSELTFFYMDIQKFGKGFSSFYEDCKDNMRFIRSRPYELREGQGGSVLVKYAAAPGQPNKSRAKDEAGPAMAVEEEFDLVILSVGIRPPLDALSLADKLNVPLDGQGFFGLKQASALPDLQRRGIFAAGAAESPKDIASTIVQAEAVSSSVIGELKKAAPSRASGSRAVVVGGGIAGLQSALSLARLGHGVALIEEAASLGGRAAAAPELHRHLADNGENAEREATAFVSDLISSVLNEKRIEVLFETELEKVDGEQGSFTVTVRGGGKLREIRAGAIVLATGARGAAVETPRAGACGRSVAFLMDMDGEPGRAEWAEVLSAAERLTLRFGAVVKIYCRNVRVSATGLESLYRRARAAGAAIVKWDRKPLISLRAGSAVIQSFDPVAGTGLLEEFDTALLVGRAEWGRNGGTFRTIAGLRLGPDGEAQFDNIWLLSGMTNRPGVFAAGSSRGESDYRAALADGLAVAGQVHSLLSGEIRPNEGAAVVDAEKCVLCLTCIRVCPHGAITIDSQKNAAYPSPVSCKLCGACAAECPARAITLPGSSDDELARKPGAGRGLTVFACKNSAVPALQASGGLRSKKVKIIEVPCAGDIHPRTILAALEAGAKRVLVAGCHPESCKYLSGASRAKARIERVKDTLKKAGYDASRVSFLGVSAVEPFEEDQMK